MKQMCRSFEIAIYFNPCKQNVLFHPYHSDESIYKSRALGGIFHFFQMLKNWPWHEISNNVVCATSKGSDQPVHTRSLIRTFAGRLKIL